MIAEVEAAWVGVAGSAVGGLVTLAATVVTHHLHQRERRRVDGPRRRLLLKMLTQDAFPWRRLETLTRVIGADEETTKRLLLEIGARGSEKDDSLWGLISRNPLPNHD